MPKFLNKTLASTARQVIITALVILTLYFGAVSLRAFAVPVSTSDGVDESFYQTIEHDYRVFPVQSILYPDGTPPLPPGEGNFFTALTDKIEFQVTGKIRLETNAGAAAEPSFTVELILRSAGQWEKELFFEPEITLSRPEDGVTLFDASFQLPLDEALALGERIVTDTQVRPRSGLTLVIRSTLSTPLRGSANPSPNKSVVTGEYLFTIDGPFIIPEGDLRVEEVTVETRPVSVSNYLGLFGFPVTVSAGRFIFPSLFILFSFAAGLYYRDFKKFWRANRSRGILEMDKVRKRYGGRVIKAASIKAPEGAIKVEVSDYPALAKVADELEKPIIEIVFEHNPGKTVTGYYVVDGETIYVYKLYVSR